MCSTRHRNSVRARRICWDTHRKHDHMGHYMSCHVCGLRIDPVRTKPSDWQADHIRRWSEGGEDTPENLWPICRACFETKNPQDASEIAGGKRKAQRHFGLDDRQSRGWRR